MAIVITSLDSLEKRYNVLEENIVSLRKSLQHWQIWEAEYEGFREEISRLGETPTFHQLEELSEDFGGSLFNEKEIKALLSGGKTRQRDKKEVLGLLSRRIEYVQENTKSISKRLGTLEDELSAANIASKPDAQIHEGHPLTEIWEELDEDDNVVSSSTTIAGDSAPEVLEILRKAGAKDTSDPRRDKVPVGKVEDQAEQPTQGGIAVPNGRVVSNEASSVNFNPITSKIDFQEAELEKCASKQTSTNQKIQKKFVTFAEGTKKQDHGVQSPVRDFKLTQKLLPKGNTLSTSLIKNNTIGRDVPAIADDLKFSINPPVIPTDESPEDAELRRQMLRYNMNEVGAIVAEMDLDSNGSYSSYSEGEDGDSEYDSSADEDEHGQTTRPVIDDDYRKQMQELEQKLNAKMVENIGKGPILLPSQPLEDSMQIDNESRDIAYPRGSQAEKKRKKGVRFAQDLDVVNLPHLNIERLRSESMDNPPINPISEEITERLTPSETVVSATAAKKPSRFKAARTSAKSVIQRENASKLTNVSNNPIPFPSQNLEQSAIGANFNSRSINPDSGSFPTSYQSGNEERTFEVPTGPSGKTHVDVVVERPPTDKLDAVVEPDELDPTLLHQEVAMEYHRMRNRIIQRNGGFMQDDESGQVPAIEDRDDDTRKKMSRFRAARLARLGK